MKIGINNIYTSFTYFVILISSGTLTYMSLDRNVFNSDLFFVGKIIMGVMILIFIAAFFYLLYKFRILIINTNNIVFIYPFLLKKSKIDLANIRRIKLKKWPGQNGTIYRQVSFTASDSKFSFTDKEFENFETLTDELPNIKDKRVKIDFEQATSNLSNVNFNIYLLSGLLLFLIFNAIWNNGLHLIFLSFFVCAGILLAASVNRKLKYKRVIKTGHNKNHK